MARMRTERKVGTRKTALGATETMAIVRGGEGIARGAVHEIRTTVTDIETARGHAIGGETATESATGGGTVHEAVNTDEKMTALSLEESASQMQKARDRAHAHAHARETAVAGVIRGANLPTRLRGGATRCDSRKEHKLPLRGYIMSFNLGPAHVDAEETSGQTDDD
jgi:hypothetical protein